MALRTSIITHFIDTSSIFNKDGRANTAGLEKIAAERARAIRESGIQSTEELDRINTEILQYLRKVQESSNFQEIAQEIETNGMSLRLEFHINPDMLFVNVFLGADCIEKINNLDYLRNNITQICNPIAARNYIKLIENVKRIEHTDGTNSLGKLKKCTDEVSHSKLTDIMVAASMVPWFMSGIHFCGNPKGCHASLRAFNECREDYKMPPNIDMVNFHLQIFQDNIWNIALNKAILRGKPSYGIVATHYNLLGITLQILSKDSFSWATEDAVISINISKTGEGTKTMFKLCPIFEENKECDETSEISLTFEQDICQGDCFKKLQKPHFTDETRQINAFLACVKGSNNDPGESENSDASDDSGEAPSDNSTTIGIVTGLECFG